MLLSFRSSARPHAVRLPTDWRGAAIWLFVAGFLQATVVHYGAIRGAVPSLIFLVVATYALRAGAPGAIVLGALGGLLDDSLAGNTGAAWTIATTVAALGVWSAGRVLFTDSAPIFAVIVVLASLVREAVYWTVLSHEGYVVGLGMHYAKIALTSALYTAILAVLAAFIRWRFISR
jgi:rod shape-determining protein MreD